VHPITRATMRDDRQNNIQWLRAIAALEVVIWHSNLLTKHFSSFSIQLTPGYQLLGGVGVELFFVVSGYLMCLIMPHYKSGASFMIARIARIVPMYWVFTSLVIVVYLCNPEWRLGNSEFNVPTLLKSYFIIPQSDYPILGVGWSLEQEMIFYVGLALVVASTAGFVRFSKLPVAVLLTTLGVLGFALGSGPIPRVWMFQIFSPYMLLFAFGWAIRCAIEVPGGRISTALAVAIWLYCEPVDAHLIVRIQVVAAVFMLAYFARGILQTDNLVNRTASKLADASFSLYLSHWFVLSALGKVIKVFHLPPQMDLPIRVVGIAVCMAVAMVVYRYLELPIERLLRPYVRRSREPKSPAIGTELRSPESKLASIAIDRRKPSALRPAPLDS
jgi:exopolysaccharide production protein ExoZ